MKYFSMFSGIGGFEEGIRRVYESNNREFLQIKTTKNIQKNSPDIKSRQNRITCIGYSEIDKYAIQTYEKNFKGHKNYGDATKINTKELPDFDLLVGGFPCQSFSIAGKRKGFNDTRGTLFFDIARILKDKKPQCFLLENVKGLLYHEAGNTFTTIIRILSDIGYFVEWQVLNSKNFGVPQNRERVFIIGHFGRECRGKIFPIGQDDQKVDGQRTKKRIEQTAQCLKARDYENWNGNFVMPEITGCLTGGGHSGGLHSDMTAIPEIKQLIHPILTGAIGRQGSSSEYIRSVNILNKAIAQNQNPKLIGMINQITTKRTNDTPKEINQHLKNSKGKLTITKIANKLKLPKTQVEHYFRTDKSRAVPSPKTWKKLKIILNFNDKYDLIVTETYNKQIEFEQTRRVYDSNAISPTLTSTEKGCLCTQPQLNIIQLNNERQGKRVYGKDGISPSLTSHGDSKGGIPVPFIQGIPTIRRSGDRGKQKVYLKYNEVQTLFSNPMSDNIPTIIKEMRIRRLTPVECSRLQGFPDNWTKYGMDKDGNEVEISDTQRYKQLGNAVTVNVIETIITKLKQKSLF